METYLAIITTALVITQVIRVVQNAVQLRRQGRLFQEQLKDLADMKLTEQDFQIQRAFYRKGVECFNLKLEDQTADWVDLGYDRRPRWKCSKCCVVKESKTAHCPECGRRMGGYYG